MLLTKLLSWQKCLPLTIVLLIVAGCSGLANNSKTNPEQATAGQVSVAEAVADVEQYTDNTGSPLLGQLKDKLVQELQALGVDKFVSSPPRGMGNNVTDLAIDNDIAQLDWTYVNIGDYDQNSEVNVADLTPVAIYFGMTPADADWVNAVVADGDENHEVNLADITPIAVHFLTSITAYEVYTSTDVADVPAEPGDPNGPGASVAETISFDDANAPPGFKIFTQVLSSPVDLNWYWVRPTDGLELGAASNAVQFEEPAVLNIPPTADISAIPELGDLPLIVDFDATLSTDTDGTIVLFEWDWDGAVGGLTWESTGATGTAQHTYDTQGTFDATVRVTDNLGATDTANIAIVVNEVVFTGYILSGTVRNAFTLPPPPIPGVEVHIQSTTGPAYSDQTITAGDGTFEFTGVPADESYEIWCVDDAWSWPGPRAIPTTGVLTEDQPNINLSANGTA